MSIAPAIQKAYLSAGSNLGDRKANIDYSVRRLQESNVVIRVSSFFETEPVGFLDQPWFLNVVIELDTGLTPHQLLEICREIEASCGRIRSFPNAPRTLDLDILLYGNIVLNEDRLVIPHPRMTERRFVLEPLAQIAPALVHPVSGETIQSLFDACPDNSKVRLYSNSINILGS
jgi:2-amino-4-hydroxy-6-hydroxymethyldihydropteridine diphosphokinase